MKRKRKNLFDTLSEGTSPEAADTLSNETKDSDEPILTPEENPKPNNTGVKLKETIPTVNHNPSNATTDTPNPEAETTPSNQNLIAESKSVTPSIRPTEDFEQFSDLDDLSDEERHILFMERNNAAERKLSKVKRTELQMYPQELATLESLIQRAGERGIKINLSQAIRMAINAIDLETFHVEKMYARTRIRDKRLRIYRSDDPNMD